MYGLHLRQHYKSKTKNLKRQWEHVFPQSLVTTNLLYLKVKMSWGLPFKGGWGLFSNAMGRQKLGGGLVPVTGYALLVPITYNYW